MAKMANSKNQLSISAAVAFIRKNLSQDMKPFPLGPNAKANPTVQNIMQEITVGKKIKWSLYVQWFTSSKQSRA